MDLVGIRNAVKQGRIEWLSHSLRRMFERGITRASVKDVLSTGEVVEDYPDDEPYPSTLIMGLVEEKTLHVVVAYDSLNQYCMIITAYYPDTEHFEDDFRTRKTDG